jgi:hypothetical protein
MPPDGQRGSALYGAAYRVVFERLAPDHCDVAVWPQFNARAEVLRKWAESQTQLTRQAYELAIDDIVARAATRVENVRRALVISSVYGTIAKPPV